MIRLPLRVSSLSRSCNKSHRLSLPFSRNALLVARTFKPVPLQFSHFASFTPVMSESAFYSLKADLPSGKTYDFADLKGKTVLIVNTASNWYVLPLNLIPKGSAYLEHSEFSGFTPQYTGELAPVVSGDYIVVTLNFSLTSSPEIV